MNTATKEFIKLAISNDDSVSSDVANFILNALEGDLPEAKHKNHSRTSGPMLLTLVNAAKQLGVSRVTFWRLVNSGAIKPIEIFEGVFRYSYEDIAEFAQNRAVYTPKTRGVAKKDTVLKIAS